MKLPLVVSTLCAMAHGIANPNIVLLIVESTDGRTWRRDNFAPVPIPNIRSLADKGVQFDTHYANVPVCCPSRASTWSGRLPHKIPHTQKGSGLAVNGVWNNYEGLPLDYDQKIFDVLARNNYSVKISGKEDWSTGGHSENVYLNSWTMYTQFPYDVNTTGGWYDESECPREPLIEPTEIVERHSDWISVHLTTHWIKEQAAEQKKNAIALPFFAYQGMVIVHPPYVTNKYWLNKINMSEVTVPEWEPLADVHPCDFQSSMLKKCTPSDEKSSVFYNPTRRQKIRAVYYAMIAEFDAMVGKYIDTVEEAGITDSTVFIVTSDHGDMNMEHQQFYKMVQYDASSRVPIVISTPETVGVNKLITQATSHVDLFPTIMEFAGVPKEDWPTVLDGESLVPFVEQKSDANHSKYVTSQFHGCNIAMSWYHITDGEYKYVVFGTGAEVEPQLFNLQQDIQEFHNIAKANPDLVAKYDTELRKVIDYPAVSNDVAKYNHDSFKSWTEREKDWKGQLERRELRWSSSFHHNTTASLSAIDTWLSEEPTVKACRNSMVWP